MFSKIIRTISFIFSVTVYGQDIPKFHIITSNYEIYADSQFSLPIAQSEMEYCIKEFKKYFTKKVIPIAIILSDSMKMDTLNYIKILGKTTIVLHQTNLGRYNIISHEAAHGMLIAYIKENWKIKNDSALWIEEAIAILCEQDNLKQDRRIQMRDSIEKRMPITGMFSSHKTTSLYYAELLSIMEFIIEKEGNGIVEKIAEESIKKKSMEQILKEYARNIPYKLDEFEKEWVEWVKKK